MYQYSFANVDLIISAAYEGIVGDGKFTVSGYVAGEQLISITRKTPIASTTFGAYGDMVVNMQRIRAGDLVFSVLMNSPENKALQDWANHFQNQAQGNAKPIIPIQAKLVDNMGKDEVMMQNGVILAMPAVVRGQTMNTVTWVITFEKVLIDREIGADVDEVGLNVI